MRSIFLCLTLLCILAVPAIARADQFVVVIGDHSGTDVVSFVIEPDVAPSSYVLGESVTYDLEVIFDGMPELDEVTFHHSNGNSPNFSDDLARDPLLGQTLYTGPESAPTFLTGTFDSPGNHDFGGEITITPETSSFVLLGSGLLGALGLMRRRLRV